MNPSTPSNQRVEDEPNSDSSKVASDPKSEGKLKRKQNKARDKPLADTVESEEAGDQIAADPDTTVERCGDAIHHQHTDEGGGKPQSCARKSAADPP